LRLWPRLRTQLGGGGIVAARRLAARRRWLRTQ